MVSQWRFAVYVPSQTMVATPGSNARPVFAHNKHEVAARLSPAQNISVYRSMRPWIMPRVSPKVLLLTRAISCAEHAEENSTSVASSTRQPPQHLQQETDLGATQGMNLSASRVLRIQSETPSVMLSKGQKAQAVAVSEMRRPDCVRFSTATSFILGLPRDFGGHKAPLPAIRFSPWQPCRDACDTVALHFVRDSTTTLWGCQGHNTKFLRSGSSGVTDCG